MTIFDDDYFLDSKNFITVCKENNVQLVKEFLARGKNPNTVLNYFSYGLEFEDKRPIDRCTDSDADIEEKIAQAKSFAYVTRNKQSLLSIACENNNFEIVKLLIEAGANPNVFDAGGDMYDGTPVIHAVKNNNFEIVKYLDEHGANVAQRISYNYYVDHANYRDYNADALLFAIENSKLDFELIKFLLEKGCNANQIIPYFDISPQKLNAYISWENDDLVLKKVISLLIDYGLDQDYQDGDAYPLIVNAFINKKFETFKVLLDKGCRVPSFCSLWGEGDFCLLENMLIDEDQSYASYALETYFAKLINQECFDQIKEHIENFERKCNAYCLPEKFWKAIEPSKIEKAKNFFKEMGFKNCG